MRGLDRVFGWLMVVSAVLHVMGSYAAYRTEPMSLLWAVAGGIAELLLAALNLLRAERPLDRPLARVCVGGGTLWLMVDVIFGRLIGNVFDVRVLIQGAVTLVLLGFSLRTALGWGTPR